VYGHPPFVAKTMSELYAKILHDPIEYQPTSGERVVEPELINLMQQAQENSFSPRRKPRVLMRTLT
jgi:hypothetical protein